MGEKAVWGVGSLAREGVGVVVPRGMKGMNIPDGKWQRFVTGSALACGCTGRNQRAGSEVFRCGLGLGVVCI